MRRFIAALLLIGAGVYSGKAVALDCGVLPSTWHYFVDGGEGLTEEKRHGAEARATLELLERAPIVFAGRLASARYLSDPRTASTPYSLLIFDHVEILKGRLHTTSADRKAFVIHEQWCDGGCKDRTPAMDWPRDETVVVVAHPNDFADPSKVVEFDSKRLVYKGRIDAVIGVCGGGGRLLPVALDLLKASADEIARLKSEFPRRR